MIRFFFAVMLWALVPCLVPGAEKTVIIGFKQQRPGMAQQSVVGKARGRVERRFSLIPAVVASVPEEEIRNLRKNRDVAYVEESTIYTIDSTPGGDVESGNSWQVPHISANVPHASGNFGTGVKIAVLDTGIDHRHPELVNSYRGGHDFVFDDTDPMDDNYISHGTHVAGIIAAAKNGAGVVGVAPEADIYAVKVMDGGGFGAVEWIIEGIEWAVANRMDVINMSLSGKDDSQALHDACDRARAAGVLLVAAGGNNFFDRDLVKYPAAYDSVIAVTATDVQDVPGYFAPLDNRLELAAPGVGIYSTTTGGRFGTLSGTSQAAPCVAGAAALFMRSIMTDMNGDYLVNNEDVRLMLQLTASDLGVPGRDPDYGFGLVNAGAASLTAPVTLRLTKTDKTPADDREVVRVTNGIYGVFIRSYSLKSVVMDVYEGQTHRIDLSRTFEYGPQRFRQRDSLQLVATNTRFTVVFTPIGKTGQVADVIVRHLAN